MNGGQFNKPTSKKDFVIAMNTFLHSLLPIPILGIAAYSGTGKTTLLLKLLPLLQARGVRVGVIKHAHHAFEIDHHGKDSFRLRKEGGAQQVLLASRHRWALMTETPAQDEPSLAKLLLHLEVGSLDLVLIEGFKHERFAKIELHRAALQHPYLFTQDEDIVAFASDALPCVPLSIPFLPLNEVEQIADFVMRFCKLAV